MTAVAQKMQTTGSLIRMPKILNSIDPYIETNLTTTDMLKLGTLAIEAKTEGMSSEQIPPTELLVEKRVGGAEVITANTQKLQQFVKAVFEDRDPFAPAEKNTTQEAAKAAGSSSASKK